MPLTIAAAAAHMRVPHSQREMGFCGLLREPVGCWVREDRRSEQRRPSTDASGGHRAGGLRVEKTAGKRDDGRSSGGRARRCRGGGARTHVEAAPVQRWLAGEARRTVRQQLRCGGCLLRRSMASGGRRSSTAVRRHAVAGRGC
uniref:Uncharacterized protein n=1 Tax=Leersia perrieri TaxID=77586 RepID=A0A0D9WZW4_9ORYZ